MRQHLAKISTRSRILEHAALIIHKKGFNNTGIQEILESAGVRKGSFHFYFKSKDDLGLALIDYYAEGFGSRWRTILGSEIEYLKRLERFFEETRIRYEQDEWKTGCPIGNLTQEMGILNEAFRAKLNKVFSGMKNVIRTCLVQAQLERKSQPGPGPGRYCRLHSEQLGGCSVAGEGRRAHWTACSLPENGF